MVRSFIEIDGKRHALGLPATLFSGLAAPQPTSVAADFAVGGGVVAAPIPGTLRQWLVADGANVAEGEAVAVIEAMKMETRVSAPKAGRISIKAASGASVAVGAELATIE